MIHEQDYIMRQVKKLTDFLIQILTRKKEGNQREVEGLIKQSLQEITDGMSKEFDELTLKETLTLMQHKGKLNAELAVAVADILFERIPFLNQEEAEHCSSQALLLYKKAVKDSDIAIPLQAFQKIEYLGEQLNESIKLQELKRLL